MRIRGQGAATVLVQPRGDAAFIYHRCQWCTLENLAIHTIASATTSPAIRIKNALGTTFEKLIIGPPAEGDGPLAGIWIDPGVLLLTKVRDNFIRAQFGIAFAFRDETGRTPTPADDTPLLVGMFHVERNVLRCRSSGVRIGGAAYHLGDTVFARNFIDFTAVAGLDFTAVGQTEVDLVENVIVFEKGDGIVIGGGPARISGNEIVSREHTGERGIRIVGTALKAALPTFLVSENRLFGLHGNGVSIETHVASAKIERNVLKNLLGNGIVMSDGGVAEQISVLGNELISIATSGTAETRERDLAAIHLERVIAGVVTSNVISGVGGEAALATVIAGIRIDGCHDVRISDNSITNIAPTANFRNLAAGVLVFGPLVSIDVSDNLIRRQIKPADADNSNWQAIRISGLSSEGILVRHFGGISRIAILERIRAINMFAAALQRGKEEAGLAANSLHGFGGAAVAEVSVTGSLPLQQQSLLGRRPQNPDRRRSHRGEHHRLSEPCRVPARYARDEFESPRQHHVYRDRQHHRRPDLRERQRSRRRLAAAQCPGTLTGSLRAAFNQLMKIGELKGEKTVRALVRRLLKESHTKTSPSELEATLLRLNPHLSRIARLDEGTPILLPPDLASGGEGAAPLEGIAGELVRQAEGALKDLRAALKDDAAQIGEEAGQAQAWLTSEAAKRTARETPELKKEFSNTLAAAKKVRHQHAALLAEHEKSLQKLQAELVQFHRKHGF